MPKTYETVSKLGHCSTFLQIQRLDHVDIWKQNYFSSHSTSKICMSFSIYTLHKLC